MAKVSTYLNFERNTEEAFNFYKTVFGGDFSGQGIVRMGSFPDETGNQKLSEEDRNLVMHVALPILGDHILMGTDSPESMGFGVTPGNNIHIMLQPDSRAETESLFNKLSAGGVVTQPLQDMFWGDYYGECTDRFGIRWMFAFTNK